MSNELTLEQRLRTAHVKRWQIVRVAREQTVAEHLYLVRVLTNEFTTALNFSEEDSVMAQQWALEHDVPEVVTGDLNSPIKAALREAVPHDDPIRRIELSLSDSYAGLYEYVKNVAPHVRALVKIADLVEACWFLSIEGMGPHAAEVQRGLWRDARSAIDAAERDFPQFDWDAIARIARRLTGG